jgi:hypothetical protein
MSDAVAVPVTPSESSETTFSPRSEATSGSIVETNNIDEFSSPSGQPFVADYFGIDSSNPEFIEVISDVNSWLSESTDGSLGMAQNELKTLFDVLNLKDTDSGFHNINRVREFIEIKREQNRIKEMQEQAEKDITEGLTDGYEIRAEQKRINSVKEEISKRQNFINKARKKVLADIKKLG